LAKKGGGTKLKRQRAPAFWDIRRKQKRFAVTVRPGPHARTSAYPLAIVLRDLLKLAENFREVEKVVSKGLLAVDGKIVRDPHRAVGLMDVIEIVPSKLYYRLVPTKEKQLSPIPIKNDEKNLKLVKITSKTTITGRKIQYGFHDGKTMLISDNYKIGDTCLIEIPKLKIRDHIPLEDGSLAIVTKGENSGYAGKIEEIRSGLFSLPKRVLVTLGERTVELPVSLVMTVGKSNSPLIQVSQ
jgi:small subunit ribosomal protein S4e